MTLFLVAAHPGLIIVDHIHFQYNGVLVGKCVAEVWLLSMWSWWEGPHLRPGWRPCAWSTFSQEVQLD